MLAEAEHCCRALTIVRNVYPGFFCTIVAHSPIYAWQPYGLYQSYVGLQIIEFILCIGLILFVAVH